MDESEPTLAHLHTELVALRARNAGLEAPLARWQQWSHDLLHGAPEGYLPPLKPASTPRRPCGTARRA